MVHYKKLIYAAKRYIESEIAGKFQGSIKGGVISFTAFVLGDRGEKMFLQYKDNPVVTALGLIDGENVDDELLIQFMKSKVQNEKITLLVPIAGPMDFNAQDIDTFARMLRE